jgi:hypothetical protein
MAPAGIDGGDEAVHKASRPKSSSQVTLCWRGVDSNFQYAGAVNLIYLIVAPLRSPRALHRVRKWAGWTIRRQGVESLVVCDNGRYR